jgi:hypothetical protein
MLLLFKATGLVLPRGRGGRGSTHFAAQLLRDALGVHTVANDLWTDKDNELVALDRF